MEDILASIRRILNEEESPAPAPTEDKASVEEPEDDDVLVLDPSMLVSAPEPTKDPREPEPAPESLDATLSDAPEPEKLIEHQTSLPPMMELEASPVPVTPPHQDIEPPAGPRQPAPTSDLMAPETVAAATSSIGSLVRTLAAGRGTQVYSGGPTLEDMVRAELRPLLKEWLDTNLPPIVERLVRTEIERVVGREVP